MKQNGNLFAIFLTMMVLLRSSTFIHYFEQYFASFALAFLIFLPRSFPTEAGMACLCAFHIVLCISVSLLIFRASCPSLTSASTHHSPSRCSHTSSSPHYNVTLSASHDIAYTLNYREHLFTLGRYRSDNTERTTTPNTTTCKLELSTQSFLFTSYHSCLTSYPQSYSKQLF